MKRNKESMSFNARWLLAVVMALALLLPQMTMATPLFAAGSAQTISLGQAANYAVLGYNILLHNTDIWDGPVGVGYNDSTGVGTMQVNSPGVVHDAPVYKDPSATITGETGPANLMHGIVVQEMDSVFADAMQAYNDALTLTPDYTVNGDIGSATTIAATHGGQYVIRITGDIKSQLVLTPYPGVPTRFIVLLEGTITLGGSDTVGASDSAGAKDVLIVVIGSGTKLTSHIGNKVFGTMLAPYRGAEFHGFDGSFIGGDLQIKLMSDCQVHLVSYTPLATIGNFVWYDANLDGIQDPDESGVKDVTVKLYDCAGNLVAEMTTDDDGYYEFTDLEPGDYYVQFVKPSGYVFSPKDQGTNDAIDSDADPTTGQTACTTLSPGQTDLTWDAGVYGPPPTAVALISFEAKGTVQYIALTWETATEIDSLGFNVYRAESDTGPWTRLNAGLIPSLVQPGSPVGAVYAYQDGTARAGQAYYYRLEAVNIYGQGNLYGPVNATRLLAQRILIRPRPDAGLGKK